MTVNYSDLIKAGFVLKVGDEFLIHGFKYMVVKSDSRFWLENTKGSSNADVFIKLGRKEDRMKWANEYDNTISPSCPYSFPEFSSLEKLTSFVRAIYETPGYKVGTKVRVKKRVGLVEEYPYHFIDEMTDYEGKICTIKRVTIGSPCFEDCKYYDGDIYDYGFEECDYSWSSSMFEPVNVPEDVKKEISEKSEEITYTWDVKLPKYKVGDKVRILPFKEGERYPFGYFAQMAKKAGGVYEIKSVDNSSRDTGYSLKDIGFVWSENQLILVKRASEIPKDIIKEEDTQNADTTNTNYVTLDTLKAGYVFKKTDHIRIGRLDCTVHRRYDSESKNRYWISLEDRLEEAIYDELGISKEKKNAMAKECGALDTTYNSPEFGSPEDLSKFVIKILEYNKTPKENPISEITYGDLIDGYILQEYDSVNIAGIPYRVCRGINGNFLYVECGAYDKIFTLLGIKEKDDFCKKFGELGSTGCRFPEFKTMEGLTKCVIELMERAEHIQVSPEQFVVSMDYGSGSSTPIVVASEPRPCSTTDTGIVRLPEIKDDFKIIIL